MKIAVVLTIGLSCGCSAGASLELLVQASFEEQFAAVCKTDAACVSVVDKHGDECFDGDLARRAIAAKAPEQRALNSTHIRRFQACLATNGGTDYWADTDMASFILNQVAN